MGTPRPIVHLPRPWPLRPAAPATNCLSRSGLLPRLFVVQLLQLALATRTGSYADIAVAALPHGGAACVTDWDCATPPPLVIESRARRRPPAAPPWDFLPHAQHMWRHARPFLTACCTRSSNVNADALLLLLLPPPPPLLLLLLAGCSAIGALGGVCNATKACQCDVCFGVGALTLGNGHPPAAARTTEKVQYGFE